MVEDTDRFLTPRNVSTRPRLPKDVTMKATRTAECSQTYKASSGKV